MLSAPPKFSYFLPTSYPSLAPYSSPQTVICVWNHIANTAMFQKPVILSFFLFFGVELLYNVVLVSAIQRSESAICVHISLPSRTSLPSPPSHPSFFSLFSAWITTHPKYRFFGRNIVTWIKAQMIWKLTFRNDWNGYGFPFSDLFMKQNLVMPKWMAWSLKSIFARGLLVLPNITKYATHSDNTAQGLIWFCYFLDLPLEQLTSIFKKI